MSHEYRYMAGISLYSGSDKSKDLIQQANVCTSQSYNKMAKHNVGRAMRPLYDVLLPFAISRLTLGRVCFFYCKIFNFKLIKQNIFFYSLNCKSHFLKGIKSSLVTNNNIYATLIFIHRWAHDRHAYSRRRIWVYLHDLHQ